ncbi:hypothetical protein LTR78_000069 [Recurvomyces mirabilis]|uniref:Uncharacterized protein n=1 Tax=Recurvomyces mirabilis TaxID=574656 RepID=A0AAE0WX98_9PEZI|nr:hypothetical protein LTR78_000069 [Recurvomyces mirabilis]KAK5161725.1 hypothetical protein LTS14_000070 [Recurvomyces mirabilis]
MAYASLSLTFWHRNHSTTVSDVFDSDADNVSVKAIPILFLGSYFLGLAAMSTWALCATKIPSWSSSPLDTALAAMRAGNIAPQGFRCMRSVHDQRQPSVPAYPRTKQKGAWSAHWEVLWVILLLWILVILCFMWAAVVGHLFALVNPEVAGFGGWPLVPNRNSSQLSITPSFSNSYANSLEIILLYALVQGPLTFGLHCAELQMNLARDEAFWRKASSKKGCKLQDYDSVKTAFTSWQSLCLSAFKPVVHWVFGLSVQIYNGKIFFGPAQIVYLALLATICATQTIVDLVDDWSATLHWGHKNDGYQAAHAGTSQFPLPDVKPVPCCG